jgi:hydroxymethylpyrimidine pyrophosphatase-like HAD family hydrolase
LATPTRPWGLLALDYDRTLTDHPHGLNPRVPPALARLRAAGGKVVLCSGQPVGRLREALPHVDGYAGENGAVVSVQGEATPWVHPWPERAALVAALQARDVPHTPFDVIFDVPRTHEAALVQSLGPQHRARAQFNVDAINVGPADATKGSGLARLQRLLGVGKERTVAIGDGENDLPLFAQAGLALAVANCTPEARKAAHRVLEQEDGEGVCAVVDAWLAGALPGP